MSRHKSVWTNEISLTSQKSASGKFRCRLRGLTDSQPIDVPSAKGSNAYKHNVEGERIKLLGFVKTKELYCVAGVRQCVF
jgi:hypothetical protein